MEIKSEGGAVQWGMTTVAIMIGVVFPPRMGLRFPMARLGLGLGFGLALLLAPLAAEAISRQEVLEQMKKSRPKDLQVLMEEPDAGGPRIIGIYGIKPGGGDGTLRSYSLWEESPSDLNVYVESVDCGVDNPLRVKRTLSAVFVRHLNPGGPILEGNREDHLVWWAACVPEVAGTDPATLREKALELGFSTLLSERQEQLPALAP